ncbi:carbohydrate kinase family protein [Macrococcoides bohemicum]|uniref:carbohydrate kinase family protein n=1 Tax=Macrococcoides bohemicum TaxID=1903056 RepID=UPI0021CDE81A|nr:PfkB family carbohydrate kinase [Macrococcus bohemicus]
MKCLIIGSTVADIMIYMDKLPTSQGDEHIKKQMMAVGGCAFNVVNVLHRMGVDYTFISPVGTGMYGDFVKKELNRLDIQSEIHLSGANGCCYCFVEENGDRTFLSHHGVEYSFNPEWVTDLDITSFDYIYVCGLEIEEIDGDKIIDVLKHVNGQIIFCPGPRGKLIEQRKMEALFALSPIIHLNDQEIKELTGLENLEEAVQNMYDWTHNTVIVTTGADGAIYYDGQMHSVTGYKATVVDTIGAGDSHTGGVIAALSTEKTLHEAVDFANLVSSKVVGVNGVHLEEGIYEELRQSLRR